jgi:signal transduction histidine kinase
LGLALVKRVAERHGGDLEIKCPAEGGTVVTLKLPYQVEGAE